MRRRWQSDNDAHMRVAVIADVHGNLPALEAALTAAEAAEPDLVVFGGDLLWGAPARDARADQGGRTGAVRSRRRRPRCRRRGPCSARTSTSAWPSTTPS